jgi:hypothetical protein
MPSQGLFRNSFHIECHNRRFKNILCIAVQQAPLLRPQGGRPTLLGFDDAYDDILRVVRTGSMQQWRYLRTTAAVAYSTVFKTMHTWIDAGLFRTAYERLPPAVSAA